ncbi:MAG TPA: zf-HC2 domain-containing protein [Acidobacteriaceae bacterium]|nr:zf-HC2 domain-containing protein [Acidobacteriaceae bacterium]
MSWSEKNSAVLQKCLEVREEFSPYLDGDMSGTAMQSMAAHLGGCKDCAVEFAAWREIQSTLGSMGPAKAPAGLQARLRAALAEERERGTHLAWDRRLAAMWHATLAPFAIHAATGTVAALLLIGGAGATIAWFGAPSEVQANDEPLGAMTAPHYLYSEVPPQPIEFGREAPVLIEAKVDDQGRVYDYTILSGPTDKSVQRAVEANLLSSVFQPATIFGLPVAGHVVMTYTGVSVKG